MMIYKIFRGSEWEQLKRDGATSGAPIDLADGYIHFSTIETVAETAAKHFVGATGLILAAVDPAPLGDALKWEASRGGALFPHLYRNLRLSEVAWAVDLPLGPEGHIFPELT